MAKLILTDDNKLEVQTHIGDMTLPAYCELLRLNRDLSVSKLEKIMDVEHPTYYNYKDTVGQNPKMGLTVLLALGFEVVIWNPEGLEK
jgi:hypothetical protein